MNEIIKNLVKKIPIAFTQNQRYDQQARQIMQRVCKSNSSCIDVGCYKGEMLDAMIRYAPLGTHYAFEPIPSLYEKLQEKYKDANCRIFPLALSNQVGDAAFNYVTTNPSYSGLVRRKYDKPDEQDTSITVKTDLLDNVISKKVVVRVIKIDVEGAELQVLQGAVETLQRNHPMVIFEHGLGGADCYGTTPAQVFQLFAGCGFRVSTMENWLKGGKSFTLQEFETQYYHKLNYYFVAHT